MREIHFTIKFISDAETSSGLGSSLVDNLVSRDLEGNPTIPASHIKGLMLQAIKDIPAGAIAEEKKHTILNFFGKPGEAFENSSLFSVTNGKLKEFSKEATTRLIARTALNEFGTAKDGSLRITEAISAGSEFKGSVYLRSDSSLLDASIRYALLSIFEMGGSRSRGAGACIVSIDGEKKTPGKLFTEILNSSDNGEIVSQTIEASGDPSKTVTVKISFETQNPVCVPETPIVGNTIISGFTIPASAVQGCILTRINALNSDVATACFNSENFRAWPLEPLPTGEEYKGAFAVRASVSHKISKLAVEKEKYNFCDETIEEYPWDKIKENLPIKSADGVMIRLKKKDETVLWRSGDMARHLSAHGVINGGESGNERNLYTVESLAEHFFVGFATMPEPAYNLLVESLKENPIVSIGKSRTVRGQGKMIVENIDDLPNEFPINKNKQVVYAFIVQSPLLIDDDIQSDSANEILKELVEKYWSGFKVEECSAGVQIRFGWNRHKGGLQKAERVITPGSVFRLDRKPDDIQKLLQSGIGLGRDRGYGSVLPHPNIAKERFADLPEKKEMTKSNGAAKKGYELWKKGFVNGKSTLSASQISTILDLIVKNKTPEAALKFLERQIKNRPDRIWDRWEPIFNEVNSLVSKNDSLYSSKALKVWHDLVVAEDGRKK